ncbi:Hemin import ATP-binding protein HmuV [Halioglobus japonicus]|nr:Hemin import ATP-binding protein HmuV [Halioglobus japonicus]
MLEVTALQLQRGNNFALDIRHWQALPGEVHAILGTNGAGKSTLLKLLSGEEASPGNVLLHHTPLQSWPSMERARHLGVLPQSNNLSFAFSAEEVVSLGLTPLTLGWRQGRQTVHAMMRATNCAHLGKAKYPALSGGEQQRVHLARVLVQLSQAEREPVLLLDEPTSAQDLGQQHRLMELAGELARSQHFCIVAILHDLNLALRYADHCMLLDQGQAVAVGTPNEVVNGVNIERYWGYSAQVLTSECGRTVIS